MTPTWAATLPRASASTIGDLRLVPGVEVCEDGDRIWLRGGPAGGDLDRRLARIPCDLRLLLTGDGLMVRVDERTPCGRLPVGPWVPIASFLQVRCAPPALGGLAPAKVPLRLVRAEAWEEPGVLVTPGATWLRYAAGAPAVRLDRWTFAVSEDGRALIRGAPLPPIPGVRSVEHDGIAVPCGLAIAPPVPPDVLRHVLGLAPGDLALFDETGAWERVPARGFVRASRSAVRASCAGEGAPRA